MRKSRQRPQRHSQRFFADEICFMKNATELLKAYLSEIQDPAAAAALFADDGVIELPWVDARAQGPVAIEKFLTGLLAKVPDFRLRTSASGFRRPTRPLANTTWKLSCRQPARPIGNPTPAASSRRTGRSNSCESHSIPSRRRGHSARIEIRFLKTTHHKHQN